MGDDSHVSGEVESSGHDYGVQVLKQKSMYTDDEIETQLWSTHAYKSRDLYPQAASVHRSQNGEYEIDNGQYEIDMSPVAHSAVHGPQNGEYETDNGQYEIDMSPISQSANWLLALSGEPSEHDYIQGHTIDFWNGYDGYVDYEDYNGYDGYQGYIGYEGYNEQPEDKYNENQSLQILDCL